MNRLAGSASSYLRQHASNPVDWWPWSPEALARAVELDRPILLSIGYASCHWCHVMARESFEDPMIAARINEDFVPIKVDREERPDIDALYIAAAQEMIGRAGWPLTMILLPDGRPLVAATYLPPADRPHQGGLPRLLDAVARAWRDNRAAMTTTALLLGDLAPAVPPEDAGHDEPAPAQLAAQLVAGLLARAGPDGALGPAPHFPRPSYLRALIDTPSPRAHAVAQQVVSAWTSTALYDHLEGGFFRYCVDDQWRQPHFEKMLADQALLARTLSHCARRDPELRWLAPVAGATLDFCERQLRAPGGGYLTSLDADAEHAEGGHVTWTAQQIRDVLVPAGLDADAVIQRWSLDEHPAAPHLAPGTSWATPPNLRRELDVLRAARRHRPQPEADELVILEFNAMLVSAQLASGERWRQRRALETLGALRQRHWRQGQWRRAATGPATATGADLAWLVDAKVDAFELTGADAWLEAAGVDAAHLLAHHWIERDPGRRPSHHLASGVVALASDEVDDAPARPAAIVDGATPAATSVAARALARLGLARGEDALLEASRSLVRAVAPLALRHPLAFPDLIEAAGYAFAGITIVAPGPPTALSEHIRWSAMSRTVLVTGSGSSPQLVGRRSPWAYVCRGSQCWPPVATVAELKRQLAEEH